jgi:hypothetical protein
MICESAHEYITVLDGPSKVQLLFTGVEASGNTDPVPVDTNASLAEPDDGPLPSSVAVDVDDSLGVRKVAHCVSRQVPNPVVAVVPSGITVIWKFEIVRSAYA